MLSILPDEVRTESMGRTLIDLDALVNEVATGSGLPMVARYAEENLRNVASEVEALGTFSPRNGRRCLSLTPPAQHPGPREPNHPDLRTDTEVV